MKVSRALIFGLLVASVSISEARQKHVPTLVELVSGNALVFLGKAEDTAPHKDPEYQHRYKAVLIRAEKILKRAPLDNPYVDKEIAEGKLIPVVFHAKDVKRFMGKRAIWFVRYYNNTLWVAFPELNRPPKDLKEIEKIVSNAD